MKKNPVKAALRAGKPQVGTWLSLGNVFAARLMARTGFPWLTVDLEHSPIGWDSAGLLFGAIADAGCVPLPTGNRSIGGGLASMNYDASAGDYYKYANDEVLVVLQTESPEGVDNAEEIYSLPGVDAIFVGPNDLKWQMKTPDDIDPTPDEFEAMLQRVLAAGKKTGTPVGLHVQTVEVVEQRIAEGWQFIALGSELKMMVSGAQEFVSALNLAPSAGDLARY